MDENGARVSVSREPHQTPPISAILAGQAMTSRPPAHPSTPETIKVLFLVSGGASLPSVSKTQSFDPIPMGKEASIPLCWTFSEFGDPEYPGFFRKLAYARYQSACFWLSRR